MVTRRDLFKIATVSTAGLGFTAGCATSFGQLGASMAMSDRTKQVLGNPIAGMRTKYAVQSIAWNPDGKSLVVSLGYDTILSKYTVGGERVWSETKSAHGQKGIYFDTSGQTIFTSAFTPETKLEAGPSIALVDDQSGRVIRELRGIRQAGGVQAPSVFVMNRARDKIYAINHGFPSRFLLEYGPPDWTLHNIFGPIMGTDGPYDRLILGPHEATLLAPTVNGYIGQIDIGSGKHSSRYRLSNTGLGPLVLLQDQATAIATQSGIIESGIMAGPATADPANDYSDMTSSVWRIDVGSGRILGKYDVQWPVESLTVCEATGLAVCVTKRFGQGIRLYVIDATTTRVLHRIDLAWSYSVIAALSMDGSLLALSQDSNLSLYKFAVQNKA
jgi:hypothetical protein